MLGSGLPVIELRGLKKAFGPVGVLTGLDMTVEQGQVYGFLGRNGAGKSTTLRILVGILEKGSGTVELFGQPMLNQNTTLRQKIGYVAQEQNFYGWMTPTTLGAFVRGFYPNWDDALYLRLLDALELPKGRKVQTFSGGMMAKQGLALALAHRPPLLVLDEPTAGLDPVARREFLQIVREQKGATTVLFSSHLVDEVERAADRLGIIDEGAMHYEGSLQELVRQVCRLRFPPPEKEAEFGPDFEVLRATSDGYILRCQSTQGYAELQNAYPEACLEALSLEDIFVELVTRKGRHARL